MKSTHLFFVGRKTGKLVGLLLAGILPGFVAQAQDVTSPIQSNASNPYFWSTIALMILLFVGSTLVIAWYLARKYRQAKPLAGNADTTLNTSSQPSDLSSGLSAGYAAASPNLVTTGYGSHNAQLNNAQNSNALATNSSNSNTSNTTHLNTTDLNYGAGAESSLGQHELSSQLVQSIGHLNAIHVSNNVDLLEKAINNTSDGIFIADKHYIIVYVNSAYLKFTGKSQEQALNVPLRFGNHPQQFETDVKEALKADKHWSGEIETFSSSGKRHVINLRIDAISDDADTTTHFVGVFSDITEQKSTEQALLKLTNVDTLTQLPNRSYFHSYQQYLTRSQIAHTLLCFDLDKFKKINDSVGHFAGDQLLHQLVGRLENLIRKNMIAFRLGGDEFAVIIEGKPDLHRISHFAQSLLDKLALPYRINAQEFVVKASIGIAFYPTDGDSPQAMFKHADSAMYFAKDAGGNRYQFFKSKINDQVNKQLNTENLIRYGLQENLFRVFYQPKVHVKSGKLCGMEALVRFEHPEQGLISPAEFIPMSEETGQILEIGEQVLRIACADAARWVKAGLLDGKVAINISALQFKQPNFARQVRDILSETGLSPHHIECEITEGSLMEDPEAALDVMLALRAHGIKLSLDDFGTGYSSLAYLKRFPINNLKIDKAFIDDIAVNHTDKNMVQAIISIAHNLGLEVIAEGVETEAQLAVLSDFGCEMMQGYLCSKPLTSSRFESLLKAENLSRNTQNNANRSWI